MNKRLGGALAGMAAVLVAGMVTKFLKKGLSRRQGIVPSDSHILVYDALFKGVVYGGALFLVGNAMRLTRTSKLRMNPKEIPKDSGTLPISYWTWGAILGVISKYLITRPTHGYLESDAVNWRNYVVPEQPEVPVYFPTNLNDKLPRH